MNSIEINKFGLFGLLGFTFIVCAVAFGFAYTLVAVLLFALFLCFKKIDMQNKYIEEIEDDVTQQYYLLDGYLVNLESLFQMHIYHGDENIFNLIQETKKIANSLIDFQVKYSTEPIDVVNDSDSDDYKSDLKGEFDDEEKE